MFWICLPIQTLIFWLWIFCYRFSLIKQLSNEWELNLTCVHVHHPTLLGVSTTVSYAWLVYAGSLKNDFVQRFFDPIFFSSSTVGFLLFHVEEQFLICCSLLHVCMHLVARDCVWTIVIALELRGNYSLRLENINNLELIGFTEANIQFRQVRENSAIVVLGTTKNKVATN